MNKSSKVISSIAQIFTKQIRSQQTKITAMSDNKSDSNLMNSTDKWFNRYEEVKTTDNSIFKGVTDRFNGITIDSNEEPCDDTQFDGLLSKSLSHWTENKRRAIWFKVHINQANWVPVLAKNEFCFHHAKNDFVMMYRWLPTTEAMIIPPFSHTMLGVGAIVINDKNEILVVSEKNALIKDSWKLPGGYLEMNENLVDAAIREVTEETNIKTKFESVVSLRHAHGAAFGCSDLYIVMKLIPETTEITKCEREIAKCCWMDLDEYMKHPNVHQSNRFFVQNYLDLKANGMIIECIEDCHQILKRKYNLYFAKKTT